MGLLDLFRKKGTATPNPDAERGDWMKWFLNREGLGGMKFSPGPGGYIDYDPFFNDGGSVQSRRSVQSGPRTRKKLQPRSIFEDSQNKLPPYNARPGSDFITPKAEPYSPNPDREIFKPYPVAPSSTMERVWNTGLAGIDKGKEIYDQHKEWLPSEIEDEMLKWELNNKYGQFNVGLGEDKGMINWNVTPWWNK